MSDTFKLALCQMSVSENKDENIARALGMLETAANNGAVIAVLPEMFNCPYDNSKFAKYAELYEENGEMGKTLLAVSKAAKEHNIYIIAGSIPERDNNMLYNSSFILDRNGRVIGRHRKVHLFDIEVPGKIVFKESDTLTAGNEITVVDTEFCRIGVAICYDMRFPELMRNMTLKGAKLIIVPAAFNMVTGPAHWEPLIRIRAVDNQVYMAAVSPARNENTSYVVYGNSMVVEPWGNIIQRAGEKEEIIIADVELPLVDQVRNELPLLKHRRKDLY